MWAEISAAGLIGLAWPVALVPAAVVLLESGLAVGTLFSAPGLQNNTPIGPLITVGTIAVLSALLGNVRYRKVVVPTLVAALAINGVAWAAVWFPQVSKRWLVVSQRAASTLSEIQTMVRPSDEVIASQGIEGGFANRRWLYALELPDQHYLVKAHKVWVIIAPRDGIETLPASKAYADIGDLSHTHGWHVAVARNDVWAFEWTPPKGRKTFAVTANYGAIPPWTTGGANGSVVTKGQRSDWHVASAATPGYVLSGDEWRKRAGRYAANVNLSVARTANVEVWDDSTSEMLIRRVVRDTHGRTTVTIPVNLNVAPGASVYGGWGIWRMSPQPAPPGDLLEIRVWSPGGKGQVKVYDAQLKRASD